MINEKRANSGCDLRSRLGRRSALAVVPVSECPSVFRLRERFCSEVDRMRRSVHLFPSIICERMKCAVEMIRRANTWSSLPISLVGLRIDWTIDQWRFAKDGFPAEDRHAPRPSADRRVSSRSVVSAVQHWFRSAG